jgi:hypothetical protein
MILDRESLALALIRLKLIAIRDQLDSLLDEAAKRELTLREALGFLVEREVARKDERRIEMAGKIAHFPMVRDFDGSTSPPSPRSMRGRSASWGRAAGWRMARPCCCWGRQASARRIWPPSVALRSAKATRRCS